MKLVNDTAALETLDLFLKENLHPISKEKKLLHRGVTQPLNLFPAIGDFLHVFFLSFFFFSFLNIFSVFFFLFFSSVLLLLLLLLLLLFFLHFFLFSFSFF